MTRPLLACLAAAMILMQLVQPIGDVPGLHPTGALPGPTMLALAVDPSCDHTLRPCAQVTLDWSTLTDGR